MSYYYYTGLFYLIYESFLFHSPGSFVRRAEKDASQSFSFFWHFWFCSFIVRSFFYELRLPSTPFIWLVGKRKSTQTFRRQNKFFQRISISSAAWVDSPASPTAFPLYLKRMKKEERRRNDPDPKSFSGSIGLTRGGMMRSCRHTPFNIRLLQAVLVACSHFKVSLCFIMGENEPWHKTIPITNKSHCWWEASYGAG